MNKMIVLAAFAAFVACFTGCKSIEVERHAQILPTYTDTNGVVRAVCDAQGKPVILDGGWEVDFLQHWMWTRLDSLNATAGTGVTLQLNGYETAVDTNFVALVAASFDGGTKLATAIGEAYVKIAGGGAQASTVLSSAKKVYEYFVGKGGDASKASVSTDTATNTLKVTDGAVCVECDAAGNCTECTAK